MSFFKIPCLSSEKGGNHLQKEQLPSVSLDILTQKKLSAFLSRLCQGWALTIALFVSLYALLEYGTSQSICMIHEEYNTHLHFYEQQYIVLVLQMQNWDARGLKGKKNPFVALHF